MSGDGAAAGPGQASYVERLTPAPWVWLATMSIAASSGLVVLTTLGPAVALLVALLVMGVTVVGLLRSSAVVRVAADELSAGRARIPVLLLGSVRELDARQMQALRGPRADVRAYLCQRGWLPAGVAVEVDDPADPTPYWLISSRHPALLSAALRAAIETAGDCGQAHSRQTS